MHVLVAGSSGFLGTRLVRRLTDEGHRVTRLVRRPPSGDHERRWDPYAGPLGPSVLHEIDAVVNLAGSPTIGNPHSEQWAKALRKSRVTTTRVLAEAIAQSEHLPAFLAGNAVAWYGDQGDRLLAEDGTTSGDALLTRVTREWQEATEPAAVAGARVVVLRTAVVLDPASAPLRQLRWLFLAGLGGPLGDGRQYFPMISSTDWTGAVAHLLTSSVDGPVNLCLPQTPTNAEFTHALASVVHRPAVLRLPAAAIRLGAGPMAPDLLGSIRAVPRRLLDDGFAFTAADVNALLRTATRSAS